MTSEGNFAPTKKGYPQGSLFFAVAALFFAAAALVAVACSPSNAGPEDAPFVLTGEAQGTTFTITYWPEQKTPGADTVSARVRRYLESYNRAVSLWDPQSELSLWNAGQWDAQRSFSPLAKAVLDEGQRLQALTNGWMDPLVGKYTEAWGFTGKNAVLGLGNAKSDTLTVAQLQQSSRVVYDVNAFAQGHSVDGVALVLSQMGVQHALVEIGGELFALGGKPDGSPFQVAVDAPQEKRSTTPATQVPLKSRGMATSGNYRKYRTDPTTGRKFGHTLNPFTGWTAQTDVLSATVLAPSASEADGVATALVAMGQAAAQKWATNHPEVQVFLIYSDEKGNVKTFQTIP